MTIIVANNITTLDIVLEDLGITIPGSSIIDLTETFEFYEIASSNDLKNEIIAGNIIINDGVKDLTVDEGLNHTSIETEYEDLKPDTENIDGGSPSEIYLTNQIIDGGNQ